MRKAAGRNIFKSIRRRGICARFTLAALSAAIVLTAPACDWMKGGVNDGYSRDGPDVVFGSDMTAAGVSESKTNAAGISVSDATSAGVSVSDATTAGISVSDATTSGVSGTGMPDAGFFGTVMTTAAFTESGPTAAEVIGSGDTAADFTGAGSTAAVFAARIDSQSVIRENVTQTTTETPSTRYAAIKPAEETAVDYEGGPGGLAGGDEGEPGGLAGGDEGEPGGLAGGDEGGPGDLAGGDESVSAKYEIAFISDSGLLGDGSIAEATWGGVTRAANENNVSVRHYCPRNLSVGAFLEVIGEAVGDGAKLVVAYGTLSEAPIWAAHIKYPKTSFILVDGIPHNDDYSDETVMQNLTVVRFNAAEAGFLAGYAAVKSGCRSLGFIGAMPSPEIADTGVGFIQGAEYASNELGLPDACVLIRYKYYGTFLADPGAQMLASDWFQGDGPDTGAKSEGETGDGADVGHASGVAGAEIEGAGAGDGNAGTDAPDADSRDADAALNPDARTQLIYAAGGEMEYRVALAAALSSKQVIVYENIRAGNMPSAAARVEKNYYGAAYDCVCRYYADKFPGGDFVMYGISEDGIGLKFADGMKPLAEESDYAGAAAALALGRVKLIRANSYPYKPPVLDAIPLRAVVIHEGVE